MVFNPNPDHGGRERDKTYPSEIAAQRPALTTRVHCDESFADRDSRHTLRGTPPEPPEYAEEKPPMESRVEQFNRQLRGGHGEGER